MPKINLSKVELIPRLPDLFRPTEGDEIPEALIGATILRIGTVDRETAHNNTPTLEGGGLVVDYLTPGKPHPQRIVFAFNELGMWVAYQGKARGLHSSGDSPEARAWSEVQATMARSF